MVYSMSDVVVPKDIVSMIGVYLKPKVFQILYGVFVYGESEEDVCTRLCRCYSDDAIRTVVMSIFKDRGICLLYSDDPPLADIEFVWIWGRWFHYKSKSKTTRIADQGHSQLWEITQEAIRTHKIDAADMQRLLTYLGITVKPILVH